MLHNFEFSFKKMDSKPVPINPIPETNKQNSLKVISFLGDGEGVIAYTEKGEIFIFSDDDLIPNGNYIKGVEE